MMFRASLFACLLRYMFIVC